MLFIREELERTREGVARGMELDKKEFFIALGIPPIQAIQGQFSIHKEKPLQAIQRNYLHESEEIPLHVRVPGGQG